MSKHFILLLVTLCAIIAVSTAGITITMDGTPNWGAAVTVTFTNTEDFAVKNYAINFKNAPSTTALNVLGVNELTIGSRTNNQILCTNPQGQFVAKVLTSLLGAPSLQVLVASKVISCNVRIPQPTIITFSTGLPELTGYVENSIESMTDYLSTTITSFTIKPDEWATSSTPKWSSSWKNDVDSKTFRDGYYTISASNLPKNTSIRLRPEIKFNVLNSLLSRFGLTTITGLFTTLFGLSTQNNQFHCTNGAMMKLNHHSLVATQSFDLLTGDNTEVSCTFPMSKKLFSAIFMTTSAGFYSDEIQVSFGFKTNGYGDITPISTGKVAKMELSVSVLTTTSWILTLIGGNGGGKVGIKSSSSGEEIFTGGKGLIVSSKLSLKAFQLIDDSVPAFNKVGELVPSPQQEQQQQQIALLSELLSMALEDDVDAQAAMVEQQWDDLPEGDFSANGMSVSYRKFNMGSTQKGWSVGLPHKGQTSVVTMNYSPVGEITPTILNYTFGGGQERSINLHKSLTTTETGTTQSSLKYTYSNKKVTVSFNVLPQDVTPSSFSLQYKNDVDTPVDARFTLTSASYIRSSLFQCSTDNSKLNIKNSGETFGLDHFLLNGSIPPTGALITCIADVDTAAIPYKNFVTAFGLRINLFLVSKGQSVAVISSGGLADYGIHYTSVALENTTELINDITDKVVVEGGRNVIFEIWGPEINSETDFNTMIQAALDVLNAKIGTSSIGKKITPSDLCFALSARPSWSSSLSGFVPTDSAAGKKYWNNNSFIKVGLSRAFADGFSVDEWATFSGLWAAPLASNSIFISPTSAGWTADITDITVAYINAEVETRAIQGPMIIQQESTDSYKLNAIGGSAIGGTCNTSSQCGTIVGGTLANNIYYCVDKKCVGYEDLSTQQRIEAMQFTGDASLSLFGVSPFSLGSMSSNASVSGLFAVAIVVVMAFIF